MNKNVGIILGIIFIFIILLGIIFVFIPSKINEKLMIPGNISNNCIELFNKMKNENPEELGVLFDDIVIRKMHQQILSSGCDYGPEEVFYECMKKVEIYQEKIDCMKNFLDTTNINKEEFMKINVFK